MDSTLAHILPRRWLVVLAITVNRTAHVKKTPNKPMAVLRDSLEMLQPEHHVVFCQHVINTIVAMARVDLVKAVAIEPFLMTCKKYALRVPQPLVSMFLVILPQPHFILRFMRLALLLTGKINLTIVKNAAVLTTLIRGHRIMADPTMHHLIRLVINRMYNLVELIFSEPFPCLCFNSQTSPSNAVPSLHTKEVFKV